MESTNMDSTNMESTNMESTKYLKQPTTTNTIDY